MNFISRKRPHLAAVKRKGIRHNRTLNGFVVKVRNLYGQVKSDRKRAEENSHDSSERLVCRLFKMAADNGQRTTEVVRGQVFEVGPRYTSLSYIGEGAYGMVV